MSDIEKWEGFEKRIDNLKEKETQLKGKKRVFIEELQSLGFDSIREAEKSDKKLAEEIQDLEEQTSCLIGDVEEGLDKIEKEFEGESDGY